MRSLLLLLSAALLLPSCSTPQRTTVGGRAVVVHAAGRAATAAAVAQKLAAAGFDVTVQSSAPDVRGASAAGVYDIGRDAGVVGQVTDALEEFPEIEVLPFHHPGPGTTRVVVWLVKTTE